MADNLHSWATIRASAQYQVVDVAGTGAVLAAIWSGLNALGLGNFLIQQNLQRGERLPACTGEAITAANETQMGKIA